MQTFIIAITIDNDGIRAVELYKSPLYSQYGMVKHNIDIGLNRFYNHNIDIQVHSIQTSCT